MVFILMVVTTAATAQRTTDKLDRGYVSSANECHPTAQAGGWQLALFNEFINILTSTA